MQSQTDRMEKKNRADRKHSDEGDDKQNIIENSHDEEIIFNYLKDQHQRVLSDLDSMDLKIAQILALDGIILSFVFDKLSVAHCQPIFLTGLFCIIIALGIGVRIYFGMEVCDSPDKRFYDESNDPLVLKKALIKDIFGTEPVESGNCAVITNRYQHFSCEIKEFFIFDDNAGNDKILKFKGSWFNIMLSLIMMGLVILITGYYYA
jgi:hypothetical protein